MTSGEEVTFSLRGRGPGPLLDAVEVEDVVAAMAAPHRRHEADHITAHHALVLLLGELLYQTTCRGEEGSLHHQYPFNWSTTHHQYPFNWSTTTHHQKPVSIT